LPEPTTTRRDALVTALAASAALSLPALAQTGDHAVSDPSLEQHRHDWDWLVGSWNVRHRRLKERLTGNTEWEEFNGTSRMWQTVNGFGTVDDDWLDIPGGAYRAMAVRGFDAQTRQWSIWWFDERYPQSLGEPVRGGFRDGVGEFIGDDTLRGQPIKSRFRWTEIAANSARWEQAFSPDGGVTWEVNWVMQFTRA
jgi:hypothetical protein